MLNNKIGMHNIIVNIGFIEYVLDGVLPITPA